MARELRPRALLRLLLGYYRDPLAWHGLIATLALVAYAGGLVMFILHAEVLGELGPAISPPEHWALDSTLGFVGFAPVIAVLVPLSARFTTRAADAPVSPWRYALVSGVLLAFVSGGGPIAHDLLVGRGTWLANRVTMVMGTDPAMVQAGHGDGVSQVLSIGAQIALGLPTYVVLMWIALIAVRALLRHRDVAPTFVASVLDATLAEPALVEPALVEPALVEPALVEPALVEPAVARRALAEPRTVRRSVVRRPIVDTGRLRRPAH